ncbi:MAG: tetratricopeptide repeat protein [Pseudomonadota bacterium]
MNFSTLNNEALKAEAREDWLKALGLWRQILDLPNITQSENTQALRALGGCQQRLERFDEAIETYRKLLERQPNHTPLLTSIGNCQQRLGQYDEALKTYKKALEQQPNHIPLLTSIGNCQQRLEQFVEALETYKRVLEQQPNHIPLLTSIGNCQQRLEQFDEAIETYKKVLIQQPSHIQALMSTGNCQQRLEQFNEAVATYRKVLNQQPKNIQALMSTGLCQQRLEQLDKAIATYGEILEQQPDNIPAINQLFNSKESGTDNIEFKLDYWRQAYNMNTNNAFALFKIADLLARLRCDNEAQNSYEEGLKITPDSIENLEKLGLLLLRLEKYDMAGSIAERISALDRSSVFAEIIRAEIISQTSEDIINHKNEFKILSSSYEWIFKNKKRPVINNHDYSEVIISPDFERFDTVIIVFAGMANRLMSFPISFFDSFLSYLGVSAIYLKDYSRDAYLSGITQLGDSEKDTIISLRRICKTKKIITLGFSVGGVGAIRYGLELNADHIIGCSTFTIGTRTFIENNDRRALAMIRRLNNTIDQSKLDLLPLVEKNSHSKIHLFFGELNAGDKTQANHLAEANNVELYPIKNHKDHSVIVPFMQSGLLESLCLN